MTEEPAAAVLTIRDPESLTPEEARRLTAWLRRRADELSTKAMRRRLAKGYRARCWVRPVRTGRIERR